MTDNIEAHYIKGVPWGGAANDGQQILFRLSFHGDQPDVNLACDFAFVPLLLGNLTEYARRAEAQRIRSAELNQFFGDFGYYAWVLHKCAPAGVRAKSGSSIEATLEAEYERMHKSDKKKKQTVGGF
jgi:hypothetical protein